MLESGWSQDHPGLEKKNHYIDNLKIYDFFTLKKMCDQPKWFLGPI